MVAATAVKETIDDMKNEDDEYDQDDETDGDETRIGRFIVTSRQKFVRFVKQVR